MNRFQKYQLQQMRLEQQQRERLATFQAAEASLGESLRTIEVSSSEPTSNPASEPCVFPKGRQPIAQYLHTLSSDQLRQLNDVLPMVIQERQRQEALEESRRESLIKMKVAQRELKGLIVDAYLQGCHIKAIAHALQTRPKYIKQVLTSEGLL